MTVLFGVATLACAVEKASEAAEKVSVDGPVTVPFQPAYRNQATDDADAKPLAADGKSEPTAGPKLTTDDAAPTSACGNKARGRAAGRGKD